MAASTLSVGFAKRVAIHGYSATFAHTTIVIAKSGDIAYELATFRVTVNDESGKPVAYSAKHLLTWEKRGGLCKVVAQSINPDAAQGTRPCAPFLRPPSGVPLPNGLSLLVEG
jgi:ketosteroid isomerase-like protein